MRVTGKSRAFAGGAAIGLENLADGSEPGCGLDPFLARNLSCPGGDAREGTSSVEVGARLNEFELGHLSGQVLTTAR